MNSDQSCTRVFLEEVAIHVRIGYTAPERQPGVKSRLLVSVDMMTGRTTWTSPSMAEVMDYARVFEYLQSWGEREHVELVETLADDLVNFCFADAQVKSCRVKIAKPDIFAGAKSVGVEIFRQRDNGFP